MQNATTPAARRAAAIDALDAIAADFAARRAADALDAIALDAVASGRAAAARRAAAIAANEQRAAARAARRAADRAAAVESAAADILAAVAAARAGKSERRSPAAIHAIDRAAARRTAAQDNGRAAARDRAAATERHALVVTPAGGLRLDVPAARVFDVRRPVSEQGATFAALLPRVVRAAVALAVATGEPVKGDPAAMLDGLTAQQAAARVVRLERAASMAAHPAGRGL